MRTWLSAADVYVMASWHEGFPVAPLEGMACGLPVVATAVSGIAEIMGDKAPLPGITTPIADVAALARALERLLDQTGPFGRNRVTRRLPAPRGRGHLLTEPLHLRCTAHIGRNLFYPIIGFSFKHKVAYAALGAMKYFFISQRTPPWQAQHSAH